MNKIVALLILFFLSNLTSTAQTKYVLNVLPLQKGIGGEALKLRIELANVPEISKIKLFYKAGGEEQFKFIEILIPKENIVIVTIPGEDVKAPTMEILLEITNKKNELSYFPGKSPLEFMQIPISMPKISEDIIILSPEKNVSIPPDELIISVSLINIKNFDPEKTQVLFDNVDVTKWSVISEELIIFVPENVKFPVKPGTHSATIILKDTLNKIVAETSWRFNVISPVELVERERKINYRTNFEVELREESVQKKSHFYARGRANFISSYGPFNLNSNLYLTSEEHSTIQPQHRFLIEGSLLDWVKIGYGDVYPNFSPLVLSGYRVRGLYGKVDLRYFQIEVINGQTRRGIEGSIVKEILIDSLHGNLPTNSVYDTTNHRILVYDYGTFSRNLFAVKPAFKYKKAFELGFTYLVSEDDKASIKYGGNPQKNVVLGSNLLLSFDNARTEIRAQGALSVRNENLKAGSWTDADIDSLLKDTPSLRDNLKKYRSLIEKFVPLNQYIVPINPLGLSSLAYEVAINLNYFRNFFKFDYIFHGSEYLSFGQPYLRQDIQGFKVFDRLRLLRNQVFLTLRYENLNDNTKNQRDYTTRFTNFEISAMYSPIANLPNLSVTYLQSTSNNGLSISDTLKALNVKVNKLSFDISHNFDLVFRDRVNFSFLITSSDDRTVLNSDLKNTSFTLSLYSDIKENLRGNFLFVLNNSTFKRPTFDSTGKFIETKDEKFNYASLGVGVDYRFKDMRVWGNLAPSFGDLKRLYIYFGGEYAIAKNQALNFNCNLVFYNYIDIVAYITYRIGL